MKSRPPKHRVIKARTAGPPIYCTLEVNRSGEMIVQIREDALDDTIFRQYASHEQAALIAGSFQHSFMNGAWGLAMAQLGERLPAPFSFLREYTKAIFTHWILCHRAAGSLPEHPPDGLIGAWLEVAKETPGLENLRAASLLELWNDSRARCRVSLEWTGSTMMATMARYDPAWKKVGTMVLQLDDEMEDEVHPFVLVASYHHGISVTKTAVTTPISVPIFGECRVPGLRRYFRDLLRQAAQRSAVVRRLYESQEIFSACKLIPRDAHAFVRDAPALAELGIEVKLPRWWKELRRPEVLVKTRVGTAAPKPVGVETLLDLHSVYVVGEHELSELEWRGLRQTYEDGLVYLRGQWMEIDRARIEAAIAAWNRVNELRARGGVTLAEALELTGARLPGDDEPRPETTPEAASFQAGPWLAEALAAIERQDLRRDVDPGVLLEGQIRGYQRQGVSWMATLLDLGLGACLADDMGLGKTYQMIALLLSLWRRKIPGPHLVVMPPSLLVNWCAEIEQYGPSLDFRVVHGASAPKEGTPGPLPYVTLTSYDTLTRRAALQEQPWGLVVLDEAQEIKNPETDNARTVRRLKTRMRVCLTGTPVENHLLDLWSIMAFLNPGLLGSQPDFRRAYKKPRPEELAALRRRVRPFILRRLKTDPEIAPTLPAKVERTVHCGLTAMQTALYGKAYAEMWGDLESSTGIHRRGVAFQILTALKQICNHPTHFLNHGDYLAEDSGKFLRLTQICGSLPEGDRVLIFTQYQEMTAPIAAHLEAVFGRPGVVLDGKISIKKRQAIVADFQRPDGPPFMVLTYGVGGTGFNLTAACHVILFDRAENGRS